MFLKLFSSILLIGCVSSKEYYFSTERLNYYGAYQACRASGLQLATITSREDQDKVNQALLIGNIMEYTWISANDLGAYKNFTWFSNGQPLTFKNFYPGEPNHSGGTDRCINIKIEQSSGDAKWNDNYCLRSCPYLCENIPTKC